MAPSPSLAAPQVCSAAVAPLTDKNPIMGAFAGSEPYHVCEVCMHDACMMHACTHDVCSALLGTCIWGWFSLGQFLILPLGGQRPLHP